MAYAWPNVQPGQQEEIILNGLPMQLVPGKYVVQEADRFGEKVTQGDLKYADFNPFESAQANSTLISGAGLQRYTDVLDPSTVTTYYKETSNVSCVTMPAVISPEMLQQTVPGMVPSGTMAWMADVVLGDGSLHTVGVGPNGLWTRATSGAWTLGVALPAAPIPTAVSFFRGALIIGYGAAHTAQYTTDLATLHDVTGNSTATSGPDAGPIYVYAATSDHASSYVAGANTTDPTIILSSLLPGSDYWTPTQTGTGAVVSLAPGGGIALLYVGKLNELGEIDQTGLYRTLVPFDGLDSMLIPSRSQSIFVAAATVPERIEQ